MVPKECALTESIAPELKAKYAKLDMGAITAIKTFPAIFASRNHQYGRAGENQDAYLGFVDEVIVQDNGIKVCFHLLYAISQRRLNELTGQVPEPITTSPGPWPESSWKRAGRTSRKGLCGQRRESASKVGFLRGSLLRRPRRSRGSLRRA